jgi:hypothetical protein
VLFALMSLALLGGLGLVLDGGYAYGQRRAMQNAADAAALAGAKALSGNNAAGLTVWATVQAVAARNGVRDPADPAQLSCVYLDRTLQPLASPAACHDAPFALGTDVSAVRVRAAETHGTFVLRALGIAASGSAATATAQLSAFTTLPNNMGPFLPCGIDTVTVDAAGNVSGTASILETAGTYAYATGTTWAASREYPNLGVRIRDGAYAFDMATGYKPGGAALPGSPRFLLHKGSGSAGQGIARCNTGSASWKGFNGNLSADLIDITRPLYLSGSYAYPGGATGPASNTNGYTSGTPAGCCSGDVLQAGNGNQVGPASAVPGAGGCKAGQDSDCIMVLPILDNAVQGTTGANNYAAARKLEAFYITRNANGSEHYGQLVRNYVATAGGAAAWVPGYTGVIAIRLVE